MKKSILLVVNLEEMNIQVHKSAIVKKFQQIKKIHRNKGNINKKGMGLIGRKLFEEKIEILVTDSLTKLKVRIFILLPAKTIIKFYLMIRLH